MYMRARETESTGNPIGQLNRIHEIKINSVQSIIQTEQLIDKLGLSQLHGQLLVDESGNGVLIMGDAGTGKSRLTARLLKKNSGYKFIADDFLLIKVIDGRLYGTHHPLKPNNHDSIVYNADPNDIYSDKKKQKVSKRRRHERPVLISTVFYIGTATGNSRSLVTAPDQDLRTLNPLIAGNLARMAESPQPIITDSSLVFTRYDIPNRKPSTLGRIAGRMRSVLKGYF